MQPHLKEYTRFTLLIHSDRGWKVERYKPPLSGFPMVLQDIILATAIVSLLSLLGAFSLSIKDELLHQLLPLFIAFAGGSMLATAFFDLMPQAIKSAALGDAMALVLWGVVLSFLFERFLHWHHHKHHHKGEKEERPLIFLTLVGDTLHNFVDGTTIAATFMVSVPTGMLATWAIIAHEIPHEISDFSLLVWGGFGKKKALFFNFLSGLAALAGGLATFFVAGALPGLISWLLPLAAGQFIYIACVDLVPELHKETDEKRGLQQLVAFGAGIVFITIMTRLLPW